jgi:hypothetical protein
MSEEYMKGLEACKKGIPHDITASAEYTRGYRDQYTIEQELGL